MEKSLEYGGLNENVIHSLTYLNPWPQFGGTVWEGFKGEGMSLLEDVSHLEWSLKFQKPVPFQVSSLSAPCLGIRCKLSATAPVTYLPACLLPGIWL